MARTVEVLMKRMFESSGVLPPQLLLLPASHPHQPVPDYCLQCLHCSHFVDLFFVLASMGNVYYLQNTVPHQPYVTKGSQLLYYTTQWHSNCGGTVARSLVWLLLSSAWGDVGDESISRQLHQQWLLMTGTKIMGQALALTKLSFWEMQIMLLGLLDSTLFLHELVLVHDWFFNVDWFLFW